MSAGTSNYYLIVPVEKTNLIPNPSFERDDEASPPWGWTVATTPGGGGVSRGTTADQRFGATSLWFGYDAGPSDGTRSLTSGTIRLPSSGTYTLSCYIKHRAHHPEFIMGIGTFGAGTFAVGPSWRRVHITVGVPSLTTTVWVAVRRASGTLFEHILLLDGLQLEQGFPTTYIDGDQDGCQWLGAPHRSPSYRPATTRTGGTMLPLAQLRTYVTGHAGVGMAPVEALAVEHAQRDGGMYQRSRSPARTITLTAVIAGTSTADLHAARRQLIDALKPNAIAAPEPVRIVYTGSGKDLYLHAYYAGGLHASDMGIVTDTATMQFIAYDPIWHEIGHQGTKLVPTGGGLYQGMLWRDPRGMWSGPTGFGGTPFGTANTIWHINAALPGTLVVCGDFGSIGSVGAHRIAFLEGGTWRAIAGTNGSVGLPDGTPYVSVWLNNYQTLIVGGRFGSIASGGGTSLARWERPATGTIGTWRRVGGLGTSSTPGGSAIVYDILPYTQHMALIAGDFWISNVGTFAQGLAFFSNSMVSSEVSPLLIQQIGTNRIGHQLRRLGPREVLVVGSFTSPGGTSGGTHIASMRFHQPVWMGNGTITWGTYRWQPGTTLGGVVVTKSNEIYVFSNASAAGSRGLFRVRRGGAQRLPGHTWESVTHAPPIPFGRPIIERSTGAILALPGTLTDMNDFWYPLNGNVVEYQPLIIAEYTNGAWRPDVLFYTTHFGPPGTIFPYGITESPDGTVYVWGNIRAILRFPHTNTIVVTASHEVYPQLTWLNGKIISIVNYTTGDGIYGDLPIGADDRGHIDTRPDRARVYSEAHGDMTSLLLPTSRLAGFRLAPGTNYLQVLSTGTIWIWWTPRYWSNDG